MSNNLRTEAQPMSWADLYPTQLDAIHQLALMLAEAVHALPDSRSASGAPSWLDDRRTSQVAFLSGARGMGKTSVMATLYRACTSAGSTETANSTADSAVLPQIREIVGVIDDLRGRLVWLSPLDAERITPSSNLVAAILSRVSRAFRNSSSGGASGSAPRGILAPEHNESLERLKRLQTRIAIAWDDNLRDRRANLDPTNMALEALQYEEAQLDFDVELNPTLEALARSYRTPTVGNPLFVLPVDDFDLNPAACVALLRIMRMISSPRLFFLVLGDMAVASTVVKLQQTADLVAPIAGIRDPEFLAVLPREVARCAADVAENMLRKLAPPAQRLWLRPPSLQDAFAFRPLGREPGTPPLHELLAKFPVGPANGEEYSSVDSPRNLRDLLLLTGSPLELRTRHSRRQSAAPSGPASLPREWQIPHDACYSARIVLNTSLRRLVDFWYGCQSQLKLLASRVATNDGGREESAYDSQARTREDAQAALIRFLQTDAKSLLQEEPALSVAERENLSESLRRLPTSRSDEAAAWNFANVPLHFATTIYGQYDISATRSGTEDMLRGNSASPVRPRRRSRGQLDSHPLLDGPDPVTVEYRLRRSGDRTLVYGTDVAARRARSEWLQPQTTAILTLLHDVVTLAQGNRTIGSLVLGKSHLTDGWAATVWRRGVEEVTIPWPAPPCATFAQLDRFAFAWNSYLSWAEQPDSKVGGVGAAVHAWIAAGAAALSLHEAAPIPLGVEVNDWHQVDQELASRIINSARVATNSDRSPLTQTAVDWVTSLAHFATPLLWERFDSFSTSLLGTADDRNSPVAETWAIGLSRIGAQFTRFASEIEERVLLRENKEWRSFGLPHAAHGARMPIWTRTLPEAKSPGNSKSSESTTAPGGTPLPTSKTSTAGARPPRKRAAPKKMRK